PAPAPGAWRAHATSRRRGTGTYAIAGGSCMRNSSFSHIADHPYVRAVERELATAPESSVSPEFWQTLTGIMQSGAEQSHRSAAMIMHEYQATKRPFGLYLRSFEAESYQYLSPDVVPGRDR